MPLIGKARLFEHDFEPDNRAIENDCHLFAGTGRDLNVLERLEQSLVVGLADRAFARLGTVWGAVADQPWLMAGVLC